MHIFSFQSNLSLLLMEDEMHEIMELFDDYDSNQGWLEFELIDRH